ncbi:hypothetical protein [Xanthomonas phaseoli]|uniref:hypothetical protein n=1 Tax=Xanthomonas phaseoli TaxID=1985254 RepID=UPI00031D8810|nr:hypothetical protein [Xanthomonas phaseoli]
MSAPRKPRLTEQRLQDLAIAVDALQGEVDYLADALNGELRPELRLHLQGRHAALARSRDWLQGLIRAVQLQREGANISGISDFEAEGEPT